MNKSNFKIVLVSPEIPGNTGSIGRTCAALNLELILIHPLGFDISEKAVRRAGLDYWDSIKISEYQSFKEFLTLEKPDPSNLFLFTKTAEKNIFHEEISEDSYLIFGCESKGLPKEILDEYKKQQLSLPILNDSIRSLNLASIVTTASYEVLRKIQFS